ncbi:MAG TPA: hypothetical protein VK731_10820 [Candidatus Cybelea sp.]|jgi:hypothetical protein|nr:hypothetical protein [Candidatus Cybelea sp.]
MNSDFEKRLQEMPLREIPGLWKDRIMAAAQPQPAWWQEWLWPNPRAWAGLAAAWAIILLLHITAPGESGAAGTGSSASWQNFAFLRQETELIARFSDSEEKRPAASAPPAATKPRSSRRMKQSIG